MNFWMPRRNIRSNSGMFSSNNVISLGAREERMPEENIQLNDENRRLNSKGARGGPHP